MPFGTVPFSETVLKLLLKSFRSSTLSSKPFRASTCLTPIRNTMKILYIGGTGEISYECLLQSVEAGHHCTIFNRGRDSEPLPTGVRRIAGDMASEADYNAARPRNV